ncbi:MAG: hypothetical protein KBS98_00205 [Flavobacterium sp.]|nr:hypothetical protein [Candidatus Neoflavobacterium equi]
MKILQFLNKYFFIGLVVAYLFNQYAVHDIAIKQNVLIVLVILMFLNLIMKFFFLFKEDKKKGTKTAKKSILFMLVLFVFLAIYAFWKFNYFKA